MAWPQLTIKAKWQTALAYWWWQQRVQASLVTTKAAGLNPAVLKMPLSKSFKSATDKSRER